MELVLASTSARRKKLLAQAGLNCADFTFIQVAPDIDETPREGEAPWDYVQRLATEKAQAGLALYQGMSQPVVLGSDTIVVLENQIFGKPVDAADAKRMLSTLSGKTHTVMTAVALVRPMLPQASVNSINLPDTTHSIDTLVRLVETQVHFCVLSMADIEAYIASKEPMDKAGSYGIQGLGGCFVAAIEGSYSAVVGLPLVETRELLFEVGVI